MFSTIITTLSLIDLFGRPVTISFFGKQKFKSNFGGFCSLLFIGFLAWALYNGSKDLFRRENPKIINSETFFNDPRELILNKKTFPIGIGVQAPLSMDLEPYLDESIYTVEFVYIVMKRTVYGNGTTSDEVTETVLEKEICTPSHFDELADAFAVLSLTTAYCLPEKQPALEELRIQGVYMSPLYEYLLVKVTQCNNDTSTVTCATPEKIDEYMSGGWFNVLYVDTAIDPTNFTRPDAKYRNVYSTMISPANYKEAQFQLSHVDVTTDAGWIIPEDGVMNFTKVDDILENLEFGPNSEGILIATTFEVSRLEIHCQRTYKKIQDVLAEVGGLANVGLMIMLFITTPYLNLKLRESLVNELFDVYPLPPKKKGSNKKGKNKESTNSLDTNLPKERDIDKYKPSIRLSCISENNEIRLEMTKPNQTYEPLQTKSALLSPVSDTGGQEENINTFWNTLRSDRKSSGLQIFSSTMNLPANKVEEKEFPLRKPQRTKRNKKYSSLTNIPSSRKQSLQESDPDKQMEQFVKKWYTQKAVNTQQFLDNQIERLRRKRDVPKVLSPSNQQKLKMLNQKVFEENENDIEERNNDLQSPSLSLEGALNIPLESIGGPEKRRTSQPHIVSEEEDLEKSKLAGTDRKDHERKQPTIEPERPNRYSAEHKSPKKEPEKISLTIWEYLSSFFYRSQALKQKMDILNEGIAKIDARLDVINIMKKLREIDKLKAMLLEYDQLILFNSLPKPQIRPKSLRRSSNHVSLTHHGLLRKATFIEQNYEPSVVTDAHGKIEEKPKKSKIDNRLIAIYKEKDS